MVTDSLFSSLIPIEALPKEQSIRSQYFGHHHSESDTSVTKLVSSTSLAAKLELGFNSSEHQAHTLKLYYVIHGVRPDPINEAFR